MYIQPNTNVYVFHGVPFDEDYENTMLFNSKSQQFTYLMNNYLKYHFNYHSFQRASRDSVKVERKVDDLYDCNYIGFVNNAYGDKVFYGFIKEVKYINDNTSEIVYEIDPLQTWMFDYTLGQCFVERQHSETDSEGDNLVPENIDTGEYMSETVVSPADLNNLAIVLWCTVKEDYSDSGGVFIDGMFSGLYPVYKNQNNEVFYLTQAGTQKCIDWINSLPVLKTDSIKCAVITPVYFLQNYTDIAYTVTKKTTLARQDGNNVKNRKCLTYPYNFLYVSNNHGKVAVYPYEYFNTANCQFSILGDVMQNPSVLMTPLAFKTSSGENFDESIELSGYPQIAFNVDSFKAWLAQSASSIGLTALASVAQLTAPKVMTQPNIDYTSYEGKLAGIATGIQVANIVSQGVTAMIQPPQSRGAQQGSVQVVNGIQNFSVYRKFVRPEFASIIDDYFTMFGYACHKVKVPNRFARTRFTYLKTVGCVVKGNMPADEIKRIKAIYDKGIRFWVYNTTIGDYDSPNNVLI